MKIEAPTQIARLSLPILGILATGWLAFNIAVIPVTSEQWINNPSDLFPVGWVILAGFVVILLFNGVSAVHSLFKLLAKRASATDSLVLTGGMLCILLLVGEKAMIDEIARETRLGLGATGEWIVLYAGLTIQMFYCLLMDLHLYRSLRAAK